MQNSLWRLWRWLKPLKPEIKNVNKLSPALAARVLQADQNSISTTGIIAPLPLSHFVRKGVSSVDAMPTKSKSIASSQPKPLTNVSKIIAVTSVKGGTGKSTTSVNLALALAERGHRVALLDADLYGPSISVLLNKVGCAPSVLENGLLEPLSFDWERENHSYQLKAMSMGFLVQPGAALAWRGLVLTKALDQLLRGVAWPCIDVMIVDTPPGTGDTLISLVQRIPLTGHILVTTGQSLAVAEASRGLALMHGPNMQVPLLAMVQTQLDGRSSSVSSSVNQLVNQYNCMNRFFKVPYDPAHCEQVTQPLMTRFTDAVQVQSYRDLAHSIETQVLTNVRKQVQQS